ncbi:MAG TPA: hypothetical protein VFO77_02485, partial [Actinoplanes sp.]|nr:hypothetical protein [Actinoplanes sp.]
YRFSMIRCAQVPCTEPERHVVDTVERADVSDRYGRMTIGADGRPVASFRLGAGLHVITCDPVACANPRAETVRAGSRDAVWSTPAGLDDTAVALQDGTLAVGDDKVELAADVEHGSGALAVTGSHVYVTAAEATTTTGTGLSVRVGETATARRQLLWRCERANCRDPVPIPFAGLPAFGGREAMAVGPDGQVLIVGAERTALFVPGKEPGA